ncbi:MAG TPA: hypothetical protein VGO55_08775 [Allosphingosinicella sp.]|jgi:hypothetical protein|nr:hypothetical protein [Allosphingosinicella sp.]
MSEPPASADGDGPPPRKENRLVYRDPNASVAASQRLEQDERHPVLIFGSSDSGKSTLIMSIVNAIEKSGDDGSVGVGLSFGNSFYAKRDAKAEIQRELARTFFEADSTNFILGREKLETTQVRFPFFIPLDLRIKGSKLKPVKIAIIDGRGEWYEPHKTGTIPFKELQDDVIEVLRNYARGISVICAAPFSLGDTDQDNVSNSDAGLWAALSKYQELRSNADDDALLFLLTKWDQKANPGKDPDFTRLNGGDVVEIANGRYERSWNFFRTVSVGADDWEKRCFMQYSSCKFIEGKPNIPTELQPDFIRYARTVTNWIYGNARRFEFTIGRQVTELPLNLFPDVVPRGTRMVSLSERFLRRVVR